MKTFTGILARPMPEVSHAELQERYHALRQEKEERETALIEHFDYDPEDRDVWYYVAIAMAELVVPAYKPPRGRPPVSVLQVDGWARLWVALRATGTPNDTKAFEIISDLVEADIKTVRNRLKAFRKSNALAFERIEQTTRENIEEIGPEATIQSAEKYAKAEAFHLWQMADDFEKIQGRPMPADLRDLAALVRKIRRQN
ncbi:MAG: hypothetical protein KDK22_15310 [Rhodobacteraceae bacterium]|nr:hypothetical protein [Paracoccaceae bacterium]